MTRKEAVAIILKYHPDFNHKTNFTWALVEMAKWLEANK
jgi:hypothetical protein